METNAELFAVCALMKAEQTHEKVCYVRDTPVMGDRTQLSYNFSQNWNAYVKTVANNFLGE